MRTILALAACVFLGNVAYGQEAKCEGQCPIETAMKALPEMQYKVAGEVQACSQCAKSTAEKSGEPVVYVVAKKEFKDHGEALTSLVEVTETFVKDFATPCQCDVSKTTTIAGKKCNCPVEASERTKLVSTAMSKVNMSYKVGDKTCNCPVEAKNLVSTSGSKKEYVVAGKATCCEMTARLNLARAKYKAAVEALAQAKPSSPTKNTDTGS